MTDPNFIILYVNNPAISSNFYADLLGKAPIQASPNFVMFMLDSGVRLGLWSKQNVEPAAIMTGGGGEIAFPAASNEAVDTLHRDWSKRGLTMAQAPTDMDFGYMFVALDLDGHRLRVYAPSESLITTGSPWHRQSMCGLAE